MKKYLTIAIYILGIVFVAYLLMQTNNFLVIDKNRHVYNHGLVNIHIEKLKKLVQEFPIAQNRIKPILGANTIEAQKALLLFNQVIKNTIINNSALTPEEQNKVLWEVFINFDWDSKNNALRSTIQDYLAGNNPFQIASEIKRTYQLVSLKHNDFETSHELLELADSILNSDTALIANKNTEQYNNSIAIIKSMLLEQLEAPHTTQETLDLSSFAINLYYSKASPDEAKKLISRIHSVSLSNQKAALQLYHSVWKNILSTPLNSLQSTQLMLANSSQYSDQALSFLLKEDGNILLADIPKQTQTMLLYHLRAIKKSVSFLHDVDRSIMRLSQAIL